jgi:DNA primase
VIPAEIIEQIRDAADMVTIISESVELKRTGSDWRGPCPFHGGTHRNFSVVPKKQMYHCFVCHESGDIFTFFMKKYGLDYPGAVKEIAGRVGVAVPESQKTGPDPNEPLYSALGVAAEWFAKRLREDADAHVARGYLGSRGISDEVRDEFGLGFAPPGRDVLLNSMRALGLTDEVLVAAGLALKREDGSLGARFWGRLLFPIADVRGRVVGFGGRILGDGEPKYLNSPESAVFHKGTLLYLLDRARGAIRNEGFAIVVEGYVDAIRLHAAGINCAVAPLGTALTPEQSKVLRRYTRQVVLSYDADPPGQKSTFRAADELLRQGAIVQVLTMPDGEDPDTLVQHHGEAAYRKLIGQAMDVFERKIQLLERKNLFSGIKERRRALDLLLPTIRAAADPVTRDQYVQLASQRTGMRREVVEQEAARGDRRGGVIEPRAEVREPMPVLTRLPEIAQERDLLRLIRLSPNWLDRARRELPPESLRHPYYRDLAQALYAGAPPPEYLIPLWEELATPLDEGFDAEGEFTACIAWIRSRPDAERRVEIDRLAPMADTDEEKLRLLQEKMNLVAKGDVRFGRKALKAEREPG